MKNIRGDVEFAITCTMSIVEMVSLAVTVTLQDADCYLGIFFLLLSCLRIIKDRRTHQERNNACQQPRKVSLTWIVYSMLISRFVL